VFVSLGEQIRILKPGFLGLDSDFLFVINILITIFWLVGITNAFNFIDSMDGLATGVGATAFAFLILGDHQCQSALTGDSLQVCCLGFYWV
jgi:UDP-N-acetylmuramyl pentapeptide phosphotransferase/UDP-N-acetylglucosamine-1-phosphate transferase